MSVTREIFWKKKPLNHHYQTLKLGGSTHQWTQSILSTLEFFSLTSLRGWMAGLVGSQTIYVSLRFLSEFRRWSSPSESCQNSSFISAHMLFSNLNQYLLHSNFPFISHISIKSLMPFFNSIISLWCLSISILLMPIFPLLNCNACHLPLLFNNASSIC